MTREHSCGYATEFKRTWKAPPIKGQKATYYLQAPEGNFSIEESEYTNILERVKDTERPKSKNYALYKITIKNNKRHEEVVHLTKAEYLTWRKKLRGY